MKKSATALLLLSAISAPVLADNALYINVGGTSHHINTPYSYNEINPGLAIEVEVPGDRRFIAGAYRNSQSILGDAKTSKIIVVEQILTRPSEYLGLGIVAGAVDGYRYKSGGFMPMAALSARVDAGDYGLRMMYTPAIKEITPAVISFQIIVAM